MDPDLVAAILDRVRATWRTSNEPEITLEANPSSIEAGRFRAYREAGVNRVSMGMQAMNDADLRKLGRRHTAKEAIEAFEVARHCFDRVSFDLIYARQDQDLDAWRSELEAALTLAIDHLSLYQLTIEEGTAFADRFSAGGLKGLPEENLSADLFDLTQDLCDRWGMAAYEVSNHARPGAESRHNLIYWRGGDYVGIGPGAHGRLTLNETRFATESPKSPALWLEMALKGGRAEQPRVALTPEERGLEYLLMSLRLTEGLEIARYEALSQSPFSTNTVDELVGLGMIEVQPDRVIATRKGRLVLNAVIAKLAGA